MAATIKRFCGWRNCARKFWPLEHVKGSLSSAHTASDVATEVHEPPNEPLKFGLGQTASMKPLTLTFVLLLPLILFLGTGTKYSVCLVHASSLTLICFEYDFGMCEGKLNQA